jgi:hypothetical protein
MSSKLQRPLKIAVLMLAVLIGVGAAAQNVYVVTLDQQFGMVNLETGAFHAIGSGTPDPQAMLVWGPRGLLYSLTVSGNLVTINPKTGESHSIGATGLGYNTFAFAKVRGTLYATDLSNNIYTVDPESGLATLIGPTGVPADPSIPFTTNPDGTINLCDETLYGVGGKLYLSFDSFTLDPNTLAITPVVDAKLYEVDPKTGKATLIGPTEFNLGATVFDEGRMDAFHLVSTGFGSFGPIVRSQIERLNLRTGQTKVMVDVDPKSSGILGAVPVREEHDEE